MIASRHVMNEENIRTAEEVSNQIRSLKEIKKMAESYGFDISGPAKDVKEAIQWTYFAYLAGIKEENGAAMSIGRTSTFIDIYAERDLANGTYTEEDRIFSRMSLKIGNVAYRDSDIIDEDTLVNLRTYKDIYERDGVHYGMRVNMATDNRLAGSYSIFREKEKGDFTDLELEVGRLLAPLFSLRFNQLLDGGERKPEGERDHGLSRLEAMDSYGLTAREYQVAELVAKGCSDDEVAETLSITPSTARKHLYNAYAKLAVNKRSQLESLFRIR